MKLNSGGELFPGWKGWLSSTTPSPQNVNETNMSSIVEYMPVINAPITEAATVQRVLQISLEASQELGQPYTFVTFDLAVAKKAYDIVWQNPKLYKTVIIHLGVFHTIMSYLGALGKLLHGSGFEEIVTEERLCAHGSMDRVMSGKNYNRAMRVHVTVLEALERLLFAKFEQDRDSKLSKDLMTFMTMKELTNEMSSSTAKKILQSGVYAELFSQYEAFKENVRSGKYGKTAQYWIQYMDRVWLLLQFVQATKTNNFSLHVSCLKDLCPLLFTMNHQNYARYLSVYYVSLANLSLSHPGAEELLQDNGFSVSRSRTPAGRIAVDMTIEQTINKHAKSKGGIVGFSRNLPGYYRWSVTRHNRAEYVSATLKMINNRCSDTDSHKELNPAEKRSSERRVQKTLLAFSAFINPFEVEDGLVSLASGLKVHEDVADDLLSVEKTGKGLFESFVENRLKEKTVEFHKPLQKNKTKTFSSLKKVATLKRDKNVIKIKAQRNLFGQLLVLSQEHNIDLQKVLQYPLTPTPWSLASSDGSLLKTNKATLMHKLTPENSLMFEDYAKKNNTA